MTKVYWTGGASAHAPISGRYDNSSHWSDSIVPNTADDVVFHSGDYRVRLNHSESDLHAVSSLAIGSGVDFKISDPNFKPYVSGTTSFDADALSDKGTITLTGGTLLGNITVTKSGVIGGYGEIIGNGTIAGKLVANEEGDHALYVDGEGALTLRGKLTGSGEAVIGGLILARSAEITVKHLNVNSGLELAGGNIDLTKSALVIDGGGFDFDGHKITLNGGVFNGEDFNNGTLTNKGNLAVTRSSGIDADLLNNSTIEVSTPEGEFLSLNGTVRGTGTIIVDPKSAIQFDGTSFALHEVVQLADDAKILLQSGAWQNFHGTVSGFLSSDLIELLEFNPHNVQLKLVYMESSDGDSGTLKLTSESGSVYIHLEGHYSTGGFYAENDSYGDESIHYTGSAQDVTQAEWPLHL